jgi:hypothetical protein
MDVHTGKRSLTGNRTLVSNLTGGDSIHHNVEEFICSHYSNKYVVQTLQLHRCPKIPYAPWVSHAHGLPRGSIPYLLLAGSCVHTQRTSPTSTCTVRITTHIHSCVIAFDAAPPAPPLYICILDSLVLSSLFLVSSPNLLDLSYESQ